MVEHHHRELPVADLVQRAFEVLSPSQAWVGDLTTLRTQEVWLNLDIVMALYACRLVG